MDSYTTIRQLGRGTCGSVLLVREIRSGKSFAMKMIELDEKKPTRTRTAVLKEVHILAQLRHPHVVACQKWFFDIPATHLCIILDYCDAGTLDERISEVAEREALIPESRIMYWFVQILMAIAYIHSRKILHRDLKPQNVFLTRQNIIKLGDFGIAKELNHTFDTTKTIVGTPCYLSPELCQDAPYNWKSDIWAAGCLLYELCALQPAFDAENIVSLFYKIVKGEYESLSPVYSADLSRLIRRILAVYPGNRPTASAILAEPYVQGHLNAFIEDKENLRSMILNRKMSESQTPSIFRERSAPPRVGGGGGVEGTVKGKMKKRGQKMHKGGRINLQRPPSSPPTSHSLISNFPAYSERSGARSASPELTTRNTSVGPRAFSAPKTPDMRTPSGSIRCLNSSMSFQSQLTDSAKSRAYYLIPPTPQNTPFCTHELLGEKLTEIKSAGCAGNGAGLSESDMEDEIPEELPSREMSDEESEPEILDLAIPSLDDFLDEDEEEGGGSNSSLSASLNDGGRGSQRKNSFSLRQFQFNSEDSENLEMEVLLKEAKNARDSSATEKAQNLRNRTFHKTSSESPPEKKAGSDVSKHGSPNFRKLSVDLSENTLLSKAKTWSL